jgi:hypothetical protein
MPDPVITRGYRNRLKQRELANIRAFAGAGINEDEILDAMNHWHLAVLEQQLGGGAVHIHLGYARHGKGVPFCTAVLEAAGAPRIWARESLGAFRSPYFSIKLPEKQRWWCGIVWLEQNRGCPDCIDCAYKWADEQGWPQPRQLGELLGLQERLGPLRGGDQPQGPHFARNGFTRGQAA